MSWSAPAAAYLATRVVPSSITSGGLLPAKAVSSLVVTSPHFWIWMLTVTLGCFALKSALTPSITDWGALPSISQIVSGPVSAGGADVLPLPQAVARRAIALPTAGTHSLLGFILIHFPPLWVQAAPARRGGPVGHSQNSGSLG